MILLLVCVAAGAETPVPSYRIQPEDTWNVAFENTADRGVVYLFYWIDHPYDTGVPFHLAGGGLGVGESHRVEYDYPYGEYMVIWTVGEKRMVYCFTHNKYHDRLRILTPGND